jgi:hypothetical protein
MTVFVDNFSDNSKEWNIYEDANISLQVENGGYVIEQRQDSSWRATWKTFTNHTRSDLSIQTKIQKVLGASDSYYGIVWGVIDQSNFYYFLLNLKKQFLVGRYINGEWNNFIPWTAAPIKPEAGAINAIAVFIRKGIIELHINGIHVLKREWSNVLSGSNIGFLAGHCLKIKVLSITICTENSVQIPQAAKLAATGMKRTNINSSNLKSIGYENTSETLEIEFTNGAVYQYYGVPSRIYVGLMQAESHGAYFYAFVRDRFEYKQIRDKLFQESNYKDDFEDYGDYDDDYDPHDEAFGMWIDDDHWESYDED